VKIRRYEMLYRAADFNGIFFFSGYGPVAGSCEHGNEPSIAITGGDIPVQLEDYQLLRHEICNDELTSWS
jgi:hypothetical protein